MLIWHRLTINPGVKIKVGIYVFGGLFLFEKNDFMTIKQIKNFIYEIDDCINDYWFVYDIQNDLFCISPHAMERFSIPCYDLKHFYKHQNEFVYDGDVALFNYEIHQLMQL